MNNNYPVFVKWLDTTDWILSSVDKFPKSVRATISNRIVNTALDVMEGIVEAIYSKDRQNILKKVNLNLEKLRVMYRIAFNRRYVSSKQYEFISELFSETGKMIGGWRKKG
jgi:flagellar biosynthesis/type III secretory pathway protein FliH